MKYLVMECKKSYAVLLDEKGRFVRAANLHYEIGQTVENPSLIRTKSSDQRRPFYYWFGGISVAAALLIIVFSFLFRIPPPVHYATVYMKINPEIRLEIAEDDKVIQIIPQNESGKSLLTGYNGKGKDKVTAVNELIDLADVKGFLPEGGGVYIAVEAPDQETFRRYGFDFRSGVEEQRQDGKKITLSIVDYSETGSIRPDVTVPTVTPTPTPTPSPIPDQPAPDEIITDVSVYQYEGDPYDDDDWNDDDWDNDDDDWNDDDWDDDDDNDDDDNDDDD